MMSDKNDDTLIVNKITIGESTYWVDKNNNKWNAKFYTKENAIKCSESLVNCYNCVNCIDCEDCVECNGCIGCMDCVCCHNCFFCDDCNFYTNGRFLHNMTGRVFNF